jgi:hypothetical protein
LYAHVSRCGRIEKEGNFVALASPVNLGFLTVLSEGSSYLGGYLVTNNWGRPLEFRLSTAVQPNRVQQVLYASTLRPYICADLIGKTLVEKAGVAVQLLLTDTDAVLDLRQRVEVPVVWVTGENAAAGLPVVSSPRGGKSTVVAHPRFPNDVPIVQELLASLEGLIDVSEPFQRIREAIGEARKMGVTGRAAA